MSNNKFAALSLALALGGLVASPAQAQTTVLDLEQAQGKTALLRSQIEETKALLELKQLQLELQKSVQEAADAQVEGAKPAAKVGAGSSPAAALAEAPPQVLAIFGVDKALYASLQYPNGVRQDVRVGDEIDGGYRVRQITSNRVVLTRSGQDINLRIFSGVKSTGAR